MRSEGWPPVGLENCFGWAALLRGPGHDGSLTGNAYMAVLISRPVVLYTSESQAATQSKPA